MKYLLFALLVLFLSLVEVKATSCSECECLNRCKYEAKLCTAASEAIFDCSQSYLAQKQCNNAFMNCSDPCVGVVADEGCCSKAGLPRSAQEYYILNNKKPVSGEQVPICIDQEGATCHYPINVIVGVSSNGTVLDYLPVNNATNYILSGCQRNCNSGAGTSCQGYSYPNGHPEITFSWNAVKFNPFSLVVDIVDETFSYSEGCLITFGQPFNPVGWGSTWNCDGGGTFSSEFMIDLSDSPFLFNTTSAGWMTQGAGPNFTFQTNTNVRKYVTGFGYCAQIQPRKNMVQLALSPEAPIYQV